MESFEFGYIIVSVKNENRRVLSRCITFHTYMLHIQIPLFTDSEDLHRIEPLHTRSDASNLSWDNVVPSEMPAYHHFAMGEELGSGVSSIVYEAVHPVHGSCAVKVIDPLYYDAVAYELSFLVRVQSHRNFTRVYDAWDNGSNWFIAMELMDGTLLDLIDDQMSVEETYRATKQIAAAIAWLHEQHIVHFDLKPENIGYVTNPDGSLTYKILDLGGAEFTSVMATDQFKNGMATHQIVKTSTWYRSLETLRVDTEAITEKVDEWSLGCIVYEMLTTYPLFDGLDDCEDMDQRMRVIKNGLELVRRFCKHPPSGQEVLLTNVIMGCLDTNPVSRLKAEEIEALL